jgi:hypothetical protein
VWRRSQERRYQRARHHGLLLLAHRGLYIHAIQPIFVRIAIIVTLFVSNLHHQQDKYRKRHGQTQQIEQTRHPKTTNKAHQVSNYYVHNFNIFEVLFVSIYIHS